MALLAASLVAPASADKSVPDGTQVRIDLIIKFDENSSGKTDISETRIVSKRSLVGSCVLTAAGVMPYGIEGPTEAEQKALSTPPPAMAALEAEAKKCGANQACLMRLMQKMSEQDTGPSEPSSGGAYQIWHPSSCRGDISIDDLDWLRTYDPAVGWGERTITTKGQSKIAPLEEDGWEAVRIEHNLNTSSSTYWFAVPEAEKIPQVTTRSKGGGTEQKIVKVQISGPHPNPFHTLPGPPKGGKASHKVGKGVLSIEWTITKKP